MRGAPRGPRHRDRVTTRNAAFQSWQALLTSRAKRHRARAFVVQGVRPISEAVASGWTVRTLLHDGRPRMSSWARAMWTDVDAEHVLVAPELMRELGEKDEESPELLAVVHMPPADLNRLEPAEGPVVVFDRPAGPGNVGTLVRSVDAFGAAGLVVTGHAADPYDPRSVRASTGSLFHVAVVPVPSHRDVLAWADERAGGRVRVVGLDEAGGVTMRDADLAAPDLLVIGNEATGMSAAWRERCDVVARIPMVGGASSLNAASAGSIALYEAMLARSD